MNPGCYTALATPFRDGKVDYQGLEQLVAFQVQNGITGILAVGTTGESPTLDWEEHNKVIETIAALLKQKDCLCIAGTGSNNTKETLAGSEHAAHAGADAVLLVDPYYNGPSSLEIRREYVAPVAAAFPELKVIPYVIPGRTGCQLLAEDLALLFNEYPNVSTVKEATGDIENMRHTRACCGPQYTILSGDDPMTFEMMTDPAIAAAGVISVLSNVVPAAVAQMVQLLLKGETDKARGILEAVGPIFNLVTVKTTEQTPHGDVVCRARNPLALKTLMAILGMPAGGCRPPLGKMTVKGVEKVLAVTRTVQNNNPEILQPLADFFNVDIEARLNDPASLKGLFYDQYK